MLQRLSHASLPYSIQKPCEEVKIVFQIIICLCFIVCAGVFKVTWVLDGGVRTRTQVSCHLLKDPSFSCTHLPWLP